MSGTTREYRLTIRNKADDADLLVLTLSNDGVNPYLSAPPSGDGQSIDPITGVPTTGSYSFRVADAEQSDGTRIVTAQLADVNSRQQMIGLRAYGEVSDDGASWDTVIPGYITAVRLISAIEYEIAIGQTRRKEQSREIFKNASTNFPGVTCVIGGPVIGGFGPILPSDMNSTGTTGWKFKVTQVASSPSYVQIKFEAGFDPRKPPYSPITTLTDAIVDFTNDWARPYFEPDTAWLAASTPIQGHYPQLRARLVPVGGTDPDDALYFVPLSEPASLSGPWYNPTPNADAITKLGGDDLISLWLPVDGTDANGDDIVFAPAVDDEFWVWVYAIPISDDNPLHWFGTPTDFFKAVRAELGYEAGVDYDDTPLTALKTRIDNAVVVGEKYLLLRIKEPMKAADADAKIFYGPFRTSTRIDDGLLTPFSISIRDNATPTAVIALRLGENDEDLRSVEGTVFDVDESTVVTAITLKQQRIRTWSSEDRDQPEADGLISTPWPFNTIENSDDDIPAGLVNEVEIGDIPGTILYKDADDNIVPLPFEPYLRFYGDEIFQRFGRGAIAGEIHCLPSVTTKVGEEVLVNLMHRPVNNVRGGERRVQVVHRTEEVEGPTLKIIDSAIEIGGGVDTGVGGGTEDETDTTGITPDAPVLFAGRGLGTGNASANWVDSYPQFSTYTQWEAHPASDSTFNELYGGEHYLPPGTFTDTQTGIGTGWVVRFRYRLSNSVAFSNWSAYSNEVTIPGTTPAVPTDTPSSLVVTSVVTDTAHAEWVNTNTGYQIRIRWQGSVEPSDPVVWANVAGGTKLLVAATDDDDQPTGPATFARCKLAYVNSAGVEGPYTDWSDPVEIMT